MLPCTAPSTATPANIGQTGLGTHQAYLWQVATRSAQRMRPGSYFRPIWQSASALHNRRSEAGRREISQLGRQGNSGSQMQARQACMHAPPSNSAVFSPRLPHLSGLPWDSSAAARLDSSSARRACSAG